jgi:hypothetical protein
MIQAHGKSHYRALPEGVTPATVLEEMALVVLREAKLIDEDRETLEKTVRVARSLKKLSSPPEVNH